MPAFPLKMEPLVPRVDGRPPGWLVTCTACPSFAMPIHAQDADSAVQQMVARHQPGHALTATAVDYSEHPLYKESA